MDPAVTCCFSGHRPARLPWGRNEADPRCLALKARLDQALEEAHRQGFRHFLCGMAQGADLYFCQAVLDLRQRHPEVTLEAAIPFAGQADHWSAADQRRRMTLLDQCDLETMVQHTYTPGCMNRRNRYMVDLKYPLLRHGQGGPHRHSPGGLPRPINEQPAVFSRRAAVLSWDKSRDLISPG